MDRKTIELYQQVILEHNKKPRNFCELQDCSHKSEGLNPMCGDHLWVYLKISADSQTVERVTFLGQSCAICKASASMMTERLTNRPVQEALEIVEEFKQMLLGKIDPEKDDHHLGKLRIFAGVWRFPSRIKCANLAWHAFSAALAQENQVSTED